MSIKSLLPVFCALTLSLLASCQSEEDSLDTDDVRALQPVIWNCSVVCTYNNGNGDFDFTPIEYVSCSSNTSEAKHDGFVICDMLANFRSSKSTCQKTADLCTPAGS